APPRTCWPPPEPNGGTRLKCCGCLSTRKSSAATPPPDGCGARPPTSPPARPSPPGGPTSRPSPPRPNRHCPPLEWVGRAGNLAIAGPSGTGKSHFVEALAHNAIEADLRVAWFSLESLAGTVGRAKADGSVART